MSFLQPKILTLKDSKENLVLTWTRETDTVRPADQDPQTRLRFRAQAWGLILATLQGAAGGAVTMIRGTSPMSTIAFTLLGIGLAMLALMTGFNWLRAGAHGTIGPIPKPINPEANAPESAS